MPVKALFLVILTLGTWVSRDVMAQSLSLSNKNTSEPFRSRTKARWFWVKNSEQVMFNAFQARVEVPANWTLQRTGSVSFKSNKKAYILNLNAPSEVLYFRSPAGDEVPVDLRLEMEKPVIAVKGCAEQDLALKPRQKIPQNLVLSLFCSNDKGVVYLDISMFANFDWGQTSLVETRGKGESARSYRLGEIQASTGAVFTFAAMNENKEYIFDVVSLKGQRKKDEPEPVVYEKAQFFAGLAFYQMGIKTPTRSFSASSPGFTVGATSAPLWKSFRAFADYQYSLPSDSGNAAMTFDQFHLGGSWRSHFGKSFYLNSNVFVVNVSAAQGDSGVGMKHSNLGIQLQPVIELEKARIEVGLSMLHFGSESVSSSMAYSLYYKRKSGNWLVGYEGQTFIAKSSSSRDVEFAQSFLVGGLLF